jgi:hypothetical protein
MAREHSKKLWGQNSHFITYDSLYREFYLNFRKSVESGNQRECFATKFFSVAEEYGFDTDQQMFCAGTLIEAGS